MLRAMHPEAKLLAIEIVPQFVSLVRATVHDPRLHVHEGSAIEISEALKARGLERPNLVLSGIPFSLIPEGPKLRILEDTREVLGKGGVFFAYQSSRHLEPYLKRVFPRVRVQREIFHIPPLVLMDARAA